MIPEKESSEVSTVSSWNVELDEENQLESHTTFYDGNTDSNSMHSWPSLSYSDSEVSIASTSTISLLTGIDGAGVDMKYDKRSRDMIPSAHEWWVSDECYEAPERAETTPFCLETSTLSI